MKEVQRWTGLVSANSGGGFVAYGDYLEQAAEIERHKQDWNRFHHIMQKHGLHPGRTDDDLLEILDNDLASSKVGLHHLREKNVQARAERDALQAKLSAMEKQEPVAWMSPGKESLEFSRNDTVYGSHTIPLYTAPKVAQPLTDEWIRERCNQTWVFSTVKEWVRMIEKAHNIGGQQP